MLWPIVILLVSSYLIGGIPFGLIVARLKDVNIRAHGSGNYGATNVGRVLGRKWGVLVLLLDAAKGAFTSLAAAPVLRLMDVEVSQANLDWVWLGTGFACVLGNTAPIYLGFKGGKGVATSLGVILGIYPYLTYSALVALLMWIIVVLLTRFVSLASIAAAASVPLAFVTWAVVLAWRLSDHYPLLGLTIAAALLVIFRHRTNIGRLLRGTESRIGRETPLANSVPRPNSERSDHDRNVLS
ncbi:MAG TPA: glycerol-3-phosphate 1-O-acyltransferase PlsY [Phycisphaerae bacterium]|nr:glycerol-3-phosphate 1-O-acyltransferase PlsY [Phycisphaerae bacterium]